MNKNLFIYSFKYLAVLIALVTFSSCEREEFTEEDADNLAAAREQRAEDREQARFDRSMDSIQMQRSIDSLVQINAGGKVFYTVNVVPGGSTAFSGGRFEEVEGLDGATVTVTNPITGQILQQTTTAGLATFELYSGEVTVNVEAPNHTDVNYVSNLTPTGGVPNGTVAYVGNVIPVFDDPNNPSADAVADGNFATIEGAAFAETDITFGNEIEESVPDGTRVAAYIDVDTPFLNEYIREANNNQSFNPIDGDPSVTAQPGVIQRIAYEEASTFGTTATTALGDDANEGGLYNLTVAATASGLPIRMMFSEFVANRTYFATDEDLNQIVTKRFLYTMATAGGNQTGGITRGNLSASNTSFSFNTTPATGTLTYTVTPSTSIATGATSGMSFDDVTVFGGNTSVVVTGPNGTGAGATPVYDPLATPLTTAQANGLRELDGFNVTAGGSGYTGAATITITPFSYTGRDAAGEPIPNGFGTIRNAASRIARVEIVDSGFGYGAAGGATPGSSTGINPTARFNNDGDPEGQVPSGGTAATGQVVVERTAGTVTEVAIPNGGDGYVNPIVTIVNGSPSAVIDQDITTDAADDETATAANNQVVLFETNGTGGVTFATAAAAQGTTTLAVGATDDIRLDLNTIPYALVPNAGITGTAVSIGGNGSVPGAVTLPTLQANVDPTTGLITSLAITNPGTGFANTPELSVGGLEINITPIAPRVQALAFTSTSGGVGNYVINNYGTTDDVYQEQANAAFDFVAGNDPGTTTNEFDFLVATFVGAPPTQTQELRSQSTAGAVAVGAAPTVAPAAVSDYKVVFAPPANGGTAATGFPVFDENTEELVGVYIADGGDGYLNGETPDFWVIPTNVTLAEYATVITRTRGLGAASPALTLELTSGGSGYAVRPELSIAPGGEFSAQEVVGINSALTRAVRDLLTFNAAGEILGIGTSDAITARNLIPDGVSTANLTNGQTFPVTFTTERYEEEYNAEVNRDNDLPARVQVVYSDAGVPNFLEYASAADLTGSSITAQDLFGQVEGAVNSAVGANSSSPAVPGTPATPNQIRYTRTTVSYDVPGTGSYNFTTDGPLSSIAVVANEFSRTTDIVVVDEGSNDDLLFPSFTSGSPLLTVANSGGFPTTATDASVTAVFYSNRTNIGGGSAATPGVGAVVGNNLSLLLGGTTNAAGNSYILAPSFTVTGAAGTQIASGTAELNTVGRIVGLNVTPTGTGFNVPTNDPSISAAGEEFELLGGPANFEVFSGLNYVRDANYGTGIELE